MLLDNIGPFRWKCFDVLAHSLVGMRVPQVVRCGCLRYSLVLRPGPLRAGTQPAEYGNCRMCGTKIDLNKTLPFDVDRSANHQYLLLSSIYPAPTHTDEYNRTCGKFKKLF
jgi:hypothetical protein